MRSLLLTAIIGASLCACAAQVSLKQSIAAMYASKGWQEHSVGSPPIATFWLPAMWKAENASNTSVSTRYAGPDDHRIEIAIAQGNSLTAFLTAKAKVDATGYEGTASTTVKASKNLTINGSEAVQRSEYLEAAGIEALVTYIQQVSTPNEMKKILVYRLYREDGIVPSTTMNDEMIGSVVFENGGQ